MFISVPALLSALPLLLPGHIVEAAAITTRQEGSGNLRERTSINDGWRFWRSESSPDGLSYDDLKAWILPSGNDFINDPEDHHTRPGEQPDIDVPYVESDFDDSDWEKLDLPHDWAIKGPFYTEEDSIVSGGMGRLPSHGVGWYRRTLSIPEDEQDQSTYYLDIDGAMSYAMVWLNGDLLGGWPYGYNSFRLDLGPHIRPGDNQLAIRVDNALDSSRWYPGAGIYRNVWLTRIANPVHVGQWGTFITSHDVSAESATLDLVVQVENSGNENQREVRVATDVHTFDPATGQPAEKVAEFERKTVVTLAAGQKQSVNSSVTIENPALWGPPPTQQPNLYVAVTRLITDDEEELDSYKTQFGIRSVVFDPDNGPLVNGERVRMKGVNQHHDLGALGGAFNDRAAKRQLEMLQEMGCNAVRISHNPPAPELLEMTDRMGLLVIDEIFDVWEIEKTENDFHLIFPEWHEADLRSFLRRDRNHPSVIAWSIGNEVGEQQTGEEGAAVGRRLRNMLREEDTTRPATASMNFAKPNQPFPAEFDLISLNYQGEGVRWGPGYEHLETDDRVAPIYPDFHAAYPNKLAFTSESASAISTRGTYIFPVTDLNSSPVNDSSGGDSTMRYVSAYELYSVDWGSSPDRVFLTLDNHTYAGGEFVWTGWDYIGEPTPYDLSRSSYFGIIDLAGFKKDRFYSYQAQWRPDFPMAHILPHWNWPDREGEVTPVHVFSSADEAELFLNGESQGRQQKAKFEYRFRWDEVVYQPGKLQVVTYKDGEEWATDSVRTVGAAAGLRLTADRSSIAADGRDLSFVTLEVVDDEGDMVPDAGKLISFSVSGPGEIVATDNGDPTDFTAFPSTERNAFNGLALAIIRGTAEGPGEITVTATAEGLEGAEITLETL